MSAEQNVFKLGTPDQIECRVQEYQWGRGTLLVRLKRLNSPEVQYLKFTGVEYFAGPMLWMGALVNQQSDEECLMLMRSVGRSNETIPTSLCQLYTISLPDTRICIIARQATRYSG